MALFAGQPVSSPMARPGSSFGTGGHLSPASSFGVGSVTFTVDEEIREREEGGAEDGHCDWARCLMAADVEVLSRGIHGFTIEALRSAGRASSPRWPPTTKPVDRRCREAREEHVSWSSSSTSSAATPLTPTPALQTKKRLWQLLEQCCPSSSRTS